MINPNAADEKGIVLFDTQLALFTPQLLKLMHEVKSGFMFGNNRIVSEAIVKIKVVFIRLKMHDLCDVVTETQYLAETNAPAKKIELNIVKLDYAVAVYLSETKASLQYSVAG
ncbi:MAG: hypothetical protein ABIN95_02995 [Mucilaginibacter sp.]